MNEAETLLNHRGYCPGKKLAFMHIPKTAGSSIKHLILSVVKPPTVSEDFDRYLYGASYDTTDSVEKIVDSLPEVSCYIGHASFSSLIKVCPNAQMLTVLREPYARQLSLWLFFRAISDQALSSLGPRSYYIKKAHGSLHQFLSDTQMVCQTDNVYIRALLWPNALTPENGFIDSRHDDELLKLAMDNVERFDFLDVIENPLFPARLQAWLNTTIPLDRRNELVSCPRKFDLRQELNPKTVRKMEMSTRLDRILWRHVAKKVMTGRDMFDLERASLVQATLKAAYLGLPHPGGVEP